MVSHPENLRRNVLLVSNDVVGPRMAGPGIRCWELARALAARSDVTIAAPNTDVPHHPTVRVVGGAGDRAMLQPLIQSADVVVTDAWAFDRAGDMPAAAHVVADLYDPYMLENLEWLRDRPRDERYAAMLRDIRLTKQLLQRADLIICASERQRDYWLGMLVLAGRINPDNYDAGPSLMDLIRVVPFGLPPDPPKATAPFMRCVHPQINSTDPILLWGGGLWDWLDPLLLLRAMPAVIKVHPNVRLIFPGVRHPNAGVLDSRMRGDCRSLATQLGLLDQHVFFGDWVPYNERANYLLEADIGVSLHTDHLEARMAYRTRQLDYIWAGLPMIVTEGDVMAERVRAWGLGEVVGYGDLEGLINAILRLLGAEGGRARFATAMQRAATVLTWEVAARPLAAYCANPHHAPDRMAGTVNAGLSRSSDRAEAEELYRLREQVAGYERGRLMRAMKGIHKLGHQVLRR